MRFFAFAISLLVAGPAVAQPDPLFQSDDMLNVTITAPFKSIVRDRSLEVEEQGTFTYEDSDGNLQSFDIKIRARGKSRREPQTCNFPPLRLNFQKSQTKGTLFEKQDKLKLVTHCKENSIVYQQSVLREYLVYRLFNVLTDKSFRVRLLRVTYDYTDWKRAPITEYGFLIEHKKRLGKRIDAKPAEIIGPTKVAKLHGDFMHLNSIFHYLISNVDFSTFAAGEEDACCHNQVLFGPEDGPYYSIPYDFDMSGFVSAEYAVPNPRYGLRRITQRFYRGHCVNNEYLPETLALFRDKREELYEVVESFPLLSRYSRKLTARLMGEFYNIIDDPKSVERRMTDQCF